MDGWMDGWIDRHVDMHTLGWEERVREGEREKLVTLLRVHTTN